jgi:hypothetical protein
MIIILIIVGLLIYFLSIKPYLREKEANASYLSVPDEVKYCYARELYNLF